MSELRAAEFFAGIGLMRLGLEGAGIATAWANDMDPAKRDLYVANFGAAELAFGDVRDVRGAALPAVDVATASFPCTDLSLAGNRRGLRAAGAPKGADGGSSMFWEFARVLGEMRSPPAAVLLENVLGFASSHGGRDLAEAVRRLNGLGYSCDPLAVDARHFVPQSRPRMFVVGLRDPDPRDRWHPGADRPAWAHRLAVRHPEARLHARPLPALPDGPATLEAVVERLPATHPDWWPRERVARFTASLSPVQAARLAGLREREGWRWRTAYRRTRAGVAVWEIRADGIAGCLRTARGGSSRQALVQAGDGDVRVRWMTPHEYARLMGAPAYRVGTRRTQALFGFGDAVCVPAVRWLAEHYLAPALRGRRAPVAA